MKEIKEIIIYISLTIIAFSFAFGFHYYHQKEAEASLAQDYLLSNYWMLPKDVKDDMMRKYNLSENITPRELFEQYEK